MNFSFAREVGFLNYIAKRLLWRVAPPSHIRLHNKVDFVIPREKFFASDVFVTNGNVDWNSEYILAAYLSDHLKQGDFIDVGAHIGYYSCLLSPYVNQIWAFEPDERNIKHLKKALENIDGAEIVFAAASNEDGEVEFFNKEESSLSHIADESSVENIKVQSWKIDTFAVEKKSEPIAIKMDIEGFEILALRGAVQTLEKFKPIVLIEYNQNKGCPNTWAALRDFTEKIEYTIYAVTRSFKSWNSYSYQFSHYKTDELESLCSKMLFLVPRQKREWFDEFIENNGSWENEGLHSKAVGSFLASYAK